MTRVHLTLSNRQLFSRGSLQFPFSLTAVLGLRVPSNFVWRWLYFLWVFVLFPLDLPAFLLLTLSAASFWKFYPSICCLKGRARWKHLALDSSPRFKDKSSSGRSQPTPSLLFTPLQSTQTDLLPKPLPQSTQTDLHAKAPVQPHVSGGCSSNLFPGKEAQLLKQQTTSS